MFGFLRRRNEQWVKAQLSLYLDGRLDPEDRIRVESHLRGCPACRSELNSLRATIEAVRHLPQVSLPRSFVMPDLKPIPRPIAFPRLRLATAVVAVLLVAVVAWDSLGLFLRPGAIQPSTALTPIPTSAPHPPAAAIAIAPPATPTPLPTPRPLPTAAVAVPTPRPQAAPAPAPMAPPATPIPAQAPSSPEAARPEGLAGLTQQEERSALLAPTPAPPMPVSPNIIPAPTPPVRSLDSAIAGGGGGGALGRDGRAGPAGPAGAAGPSPTPTPQTSELGKLADTSGKSQIPATPGGPPEAPIPSPSLSQAPIYRGLVRQLEMGLATLVLLLGLATAYAWRQGRKITKNRKETI